MRSKRPQRVIRNAKVYESTSTMRIKTDGRAQRWSY